LSAPEREVTSPSDFKVVGGALDYPRTIPAKSGLIWFSGFNVRGCRVLKHQIDVDVNYHMIMTMTVIRIH
jgi:hypothetical protein